MMDSEQLENRVLLEESLDVFKDEVTEILRGLNSRRGKILSHFRRWEMNRLELLDNLKNTNRILQATHVRSNKHQSLGSVVSIGGNIWGLAGLLAFNPITAGVGIAISAGGGLYSASHAIANHVKSRKLVKEIERLLNVDKEILESLLNTIDEYVDRVQVLSRILKDEEEIRLGDFIGNVSLGGTAALTNFFKITRVALKSSAVVFQKASMIIKQSKIFTFFFPAAGAAASAASGATKAIASKLSLGFSLIFDVALLVKSTNEVVNQKKPDVVLQFERTVEHLEKEFEVISNTLVPILETPWQYN